MPIMRRWILGGVVGAGALLLLTALDGRAESQTAPAGGITLQSEFLLVRFDPNGDLREISQLNGDKKGWSVTLPAVDPFWFMLFNDKQVAASTSKLVALRAWKDMQGSALDATYEHAEAKLRITFSYRLDAAEPSLLKTRYRLSSSSAEPRTFRFYVNTIGNLKATEKCWVVYPYGSGQLIRADKVKQGERPAPGHMWMQFMGYFDDEGHGLLSYARDTSGYLKYATLIPRNGLTLLWSDVVVLPAQGGYELPFDYVLEPLSTSDTFNDICHAYARWARKQSWMTTVDEKIRRRPDLKRLIDQGIVRDVCYGDLSVDKRTGKRVPRQNAFFPKDQKEQMIQDPTQFDKILGHARSLENLYSVKPVYRLDGWWGRFDSGYPEVLPVYKGLGGDKKFKWFLKENEREGRLVVLHDNPMQYDTENERYDKSQMVMMEEGKPESLSLSIWSGNRSAYVSPRFAIPPNLEVIRTLQQWGGRGIWWDVIGSMSPFIDFNPSARYPYYGRDSYFQSLLELFAALRNTAPDMIYGTENGQEMMLPYFDYAPAYALGPEDATTTWAPLNELVYGDAFINAVGIEGNGDIYGNVGRVTSSLYGTTLGSDGQMAWTAEYTSVIQGIFEVNSVVGVVADQQMQRHVIDPRGWRASLWPNAVVIGNTDSDQPINVSLDTPIGKVTVEQIRRYGFVVLTRQGSWVCWGARKLSLNDKVVVATSTPEMIAINNAKRLTVFRYLWREPTAADLKMPARESWVLSCPALTETIRARGFAAVGSKTVVKADKIDSENLQFNAPALTDAYRVAWEAKP